MSSDRIRSSLVLFVPFCFFLSSCSLLRESGVPAPEMETTETGIATGAVLGAGVGALVGSASGQAGMGVVLGSVAGAATGGVIGKALEDQEKRVDAHDEKLGINTKSKEKSSNRSKLWARADRSELDLDYNKPSGNKGLAAQHSSASSNTISPKSRGRFAESEGLSPSSSLTPSVSGFGSQSSNRRPIVQLQSENKTPQPKTLTKTTPLYSARESNTDFGAARVELQKPRPELPAFAPPPLRRPSLGETKSNPEIKANQGTINSSGLPLARSEIAKSDMAPERVEPAKVAPTTKSQQVIAKAPVITAPIIEKPKQVASIEENKPALQPAIVNSAIVESAPAKSKAESRPSSTCEQGKKEIERARNSASDSDKVFYYRRAILACPKEASLRVELGKVYARLGLKDDARKEFNTALDADPSNESAQDELSIMMLEGR